MERNSQFMSLPKSMVDALQKEEMLLVAGGSVGQEASTTNNADGTCSGTNNEVENVLAPTMGQVNAMCL